MKLTFLDMEFANTRNKSICQIGIVCRDLNDLGEAAETRNLIIDPEDVFSQECVSIHHINEATVKGAPSIKKAWGDLERFFTNSIIVGHNIAQKNLDALYHNLERYQIEAPKMYYICTYHCAQKHLSPFSVPDYALDTLCQHYGIPLASRHNAFHNACAVSDLFDHFVREERIEYQEEIKPFFPQDNSLGFDDSDNFGLSSEIHNMYGEIKGFSLDRQISEDEISSLKEWRERLSVYQSVAYVAEIVDQIDRILQDEVVTLEEMRGLELQIQRYLNVADTSAATLATHILSGIIKGIITDDEIIDEECLRLRDWLYEHYYLAGHYPFDKMFETVETVLQDKILTKEEAGALKKEIKLLLEPTERLKREIHSINEKRVCLIGYVPSKHKSALEQYVIDNGGVLSEKVEDADYLVVNETNRKGSALVKKTQKKLGENGTALFLKEQDLCPPEKTFSDVLFDFIDEKGLSDAETYKKARLPRQMMSKIKCQPNYKPEKKNICSFAIALELNLQQTNLLLSSAGYVLSLSIPFDRIIRQYISERKYDIDAINQSLYEIGAPLLAL